MHIQLRREDGCRKHSFSSHQSSTSYFVLQPDPHIAEMLIALATLISPLLKLAEYVVFFRSAHDELTLQANIANTME